MDPLILCGAIVDAQQIVAAASLKFDNVPTQHEVRLDKKRRREAAPYKCNVSVQHMSLLRCISQNTISLVLIKCC
jgi:hypothetical protein